MKITTEVQMITGRMGMIIPGVGTVYAPVRILVDDESVSIQVETDKESLAVAVELVYNEETNRAHVRVREAKGGFPSVTVVDMIPISSAPDEMAH